MENPWTPATEKPPQWVVVMTRNAVMTLLCDEQDRPLKYSQGRWFTPEGQPATEPTHWRNMSIEERRVRL